MWPPESVWLRHSSSGIEVQEKKKGLGGNPIIDAVPHIFSMIYLTYKMKKIPQTWLIAIWSNSLRSVEWTSRAKSLYTQRLQTRVPLGGWEWREGCVKAMPSCTGPVEGTLHDKALHCKGTVSSVMLTHAGRVLTTLRAEFTSEQLAWTAILDSYTPGSSQPLLLPRVKMLTSVDHGSGPNIYSHGPLGSVFNIFFVLWTIWIPHFTWHE